MKKLLIAAAIVIALVLGFFVLNQELPEPEYQGETEKLSVAISALEATTLLRIAEEKGFFEKKGLEITFIEDDLGKFSLKRLLDDEVDIATAAEFPFVAQSFNRDDLRLFSTIHASNKNVRLFVTKSSGAEKVEDLVGKNIATTKGTVGEFFLELILLANGLRSEEVNIVDLRPVDIFKGLEDNTIDGFALRDPHVYRAEQLLGDNAIVFPSQPIDEVYTATFNLISKKEIIDEKSAAFLRFLEALVEAENFVIKNPEEAQSIIAKQLDLELEYLENTWSNSEFKLQLAQSLLVGMEDEARWRIEKKLTDKTKTPNLLEMIDTKLLFQVKPQAMQVIVPN